MNAASKNVTEFTRSGTTLTVVGNYPTGNGTNPTDIAFATLGATTYAYVQGAASIVVFDVTTSGTGKLVQTIDQQGIGAYAAGASVYVVTAPATTGAASTTSPAATSAGQATTAAAGSTSTSAAGFVAPSFLVVIALLAMQFFRL